MMLDWLADKHGLEGAAEAGERIVRAVDKVYAEGIKPMELAAATARRYGEGGAGGAVGADRLQPVAKTIPCKSLCALGRS